MRLRRLCGSFLASILAERFVYPLLSQGRVKGGVHRVVGQFEAAVFGWSVAWKPQITSHMPTYRF